MDSAESPAAPTTLARHYKVPTWRPPSPKNSSQRQTSPVPRSPRANREPGPPGPEFNGFLGPMPTVEDNTVTGAPSPVRAKRQRTEGITVLSRALRQCQQVAENFPPASLSTGTQAALCQLMQRQGWERTQGTWQNSLQNAQSLNHSSIRATSPSKSPRRATSPQFKTRTMKEMIPAVNHNRTPAIEHGMSGCEEQMILLPINKKLTIQEVTSTTDLYKQLAGHRAFTIQFDTGDTKEDSSYKRQPYLLNKLPERYRSTMTWSQTKSVFASPIVEPLKGQGYPNTREETVRSTGKALGEDDKSAATGELLSAFEQIEASQSVEQFQVPHMPKIAPKHRVSVHPSVKNTPRTPFPLI